MVRGFVMRKSHCLITVFLHIGLVLRSLFRVFFVHGARLHVLRTGIWQDAENQKPITVFMLIFSFGTDPLEY